MTTMDLHDTIERLTRERDSARRDRDLAAVRRDEMARDLDRERESIPARIIEHSRAIVAGIAGAMGLDASGEGDEIHARILAEHGRLTREHALVGEEYRRDIAELRERMTRVECDRARLLDDVARLTSTARAP